MLSRVNQHDEYYTFHILQVLFIRSIYFLMCSCLCIIGTNSQQFHPIYYLRPSILSLLIVVTQIRGHIAGSSPPLPTTVRALHFYREKISALSFVVDSRRIVLTHAITGVHNNQDQIWSEKLEWYIGFYVDHRSWLLWSPVNRRSQQLILFFIFANKFKSRHGGIRTHGPTLVVVLIVAFEGYHYRYSYIRCKLYLFS